MGSTEIFPSSVAGPKTSEPVVLVGMEEESERWWSKHKSVEERGGAGGGGGGGMEREDWDKTGEGSREGQSGEKWRELISIDHHRQLHYQHLLDTQWIHNHFLLCVGSYAYVYLRVCVSMQYRAHYFLNVVWKRFSSLHSPSGYFGFTWLQNSLSRQETTYFNEKTTEWSCVCCNQITVIPL